LRTDGYVRQLEVTPNAYLLLIRIPSSKLKDVVRSLEILKADLKHRIEMGEQ